MIRRILLTIAVAILFALAIQPAIAQQPSGGTGRFVASGDSRNCGDVVMPAIAETAKKNQAAFFWHRGDIRWTSTCDAYIQHQPEHIKTQMSVGESERIDESDP